MIDRLISIYRDHGKIIVGVDFDDTIFKYNDWCLESDCSFLRNLLKELKPYITICLYTIASHDSLKYKLALMDAWEIKPGFINESPIHMVSNKPYFNILLDDKAGLKETTEILIDFRNRIKSIPIL